MEIVNPVDVPFFTVVPRSVLTLALGSVQECFPSQFDVLAIATVGESASQKARSQRICIMDSAIYTGHVADADRLSIRKGLDITNNVLAGTLGNLQIFFLV